MIEPWGKLARAADGTAAPARLSLVSHCIDVAAVAGALMRLPTWYQRLCQAAGRPLTETDLDRLTALAFLHDVGKASAGFYSKGEAPELAAQWRRDARVGGSRVATGHVQVVGPFFTLDDPAIAPLRAALGFFEIMAWGGDDPGTEAVESLWLAAISHHGKPATLCGDLTLAGQDLHAAVASWTRPVAGYLPETGLRRLGQAVRALMPQAFAAGQPAWRSRPELAHAFAGLVSLADWIGSNTDAGYFPFDLGRVQDEARWPVAQAQASEVLKAMRIDVEGARADLRQRQPSFESLFDNHAPRPMQGAMGQPDLGQLVVVEAETGSGKTEAALWRFKTLFEAGLVDALCFVLPTRVSATAVAQRVQAFLNALFPDPAHRPNAVLAVPGYLRANGIEGRPLPGFEVLWDDDRDPNHKPLYWAAENSKRYFAAGCATGTIDQLLLSTLQTKHAHLRASVLLRALVVVDEVHASDAYMTALMREALRRHVRLGGHALLMSATLTGEARAQLVGVGQPASPPGAALADALAPYPAVTDRVRVRPCDSTSPAKHIALRVLPCMRDAQAVAAVVAKAVGEGARVLVLRNTVGLALATQQAIEALLGPEHPALFRPGQDAGSVVVAMHHGRYAFEDRRCLDIAVERAFGKPAALSVVPRVLVGTQTLEISLDCDADLMVTDLAPIDVLLQRLGRLHRHNQRDPVRPAGFRRAQVVVLAPVEPDLGFLLKTGGGRGLGLGKNSAYTNVLALQSTLRLVLAGAQGAGWSIPKDNRALVEAGVSKQALERLALELGGDWPQAWQADFGVLAAKAMQALPVMVRWDDDWESTQWSELGEAVRTRLGLDGIDLDLLTPWLSPLGQHLTRLTVPRWMLPKTWVGLPELSDQHDLGDGLLIEVGGQRLRYDRLGLRPA